MNTTCPSIAVIGSCVTMDALKALDLSRKQLVFNVARQSLAGLTAEPPHAAYPDPAVLNGLSLPPTVLQWLKTDLTKAAPSMLECRQCDILIFDLMDERFDLMLLPSGLVVNASQDFLASGLAEMPIFAEARRIPRLSQEAWDLWEAGLVRLRQWFVQSPIRRCKILLHRVSWASSCLTPSGERQDLPDATAILPAPEGPVSRQAHQALLDRYHARFLAEFPETVVVEAPDACIADPDHHWGPAPYHFISSYYSAIAQQLHRHGVPAWPPQAALRHIS